MIGNGISSDLWTRMKKAKTYYLFLLPLMAYFIIFHYFPMYGVVIAFKDYKLSQGIVGSEWVAFEHFSRLFKSPSFSSVFKNTVIISLMKTVIGFPMPIILALMLNEVKYLKFKKTVQTISYLPHFISWVILAGMFYDILSPNRGIVNFVITSLGFSPVYFMAEPTYFRWIILFSSIWQTVGWGSIIYLSAISSINMEQYEASYIEGATRVQNAWYITIPSILPVVSIMFILQIGRIMNVGFDQLFNMLNPLVYSTGDIIDTYVYRIGLTKLQYSFSTAVGLFKNMIGLILVLITNYTVKRMSDEKNTLW